LKLCPRSGDAQQDAAALLEKSSVPGSKVVDDADGGRGGASVSDGSDQSSHEFSASGAPAASVSRA